MENATHIHLVTGLTFDKSKPSVIWLFCFWVLVTFLSHKEALIVMTWAQKNWFIIEIQHL